jgi:hypothetical protein
MHDVNTKNHREMFVADFRIAYSINNRIVNERGEFLLANKCCREKTASSVAL